jgi:hypothetical protein
MEVSSKAGPRLDEDLKRPTRGGEDTKHPESGLEEEPRPPAAVPEVEDRSELARSLQPSAFPARPAELIERAAEQTAPDHIIERLRQLPDRVYSTVEEVWEATAGD